MKKVLVLVLVLFIMIASDSIAGMPYTFSPGTAIKSSEVNANLQYANYGNIVVKANGVEIGTLIDFGYGSTVIQLLNSKGFLVAIKHGTGYINYSSAIYGFAYTTTDCTGTPYGDANIYLQGTVLRRYSGEFFYIDKNAAATTVTINSVYGLSGCSSGTITSSYYPLTPNDPTVTGVSLATFGTPITIERR